MKFFKRFLIWLSSVVVVLLIAVGVSQLCAIHLGWSPHHTIEFSIKISIGLVGLVSWLIPSPIKTRKANRKKIAIAIANDLQIDNVIKQEDHHKAVVSIFESMDRQHCKVEIVKPDSGISLGKLIEKE